MDLLDPIDLYIKQGETLRLTLGLTRDGVPVDYTGYTARLQERDAPESGVVRLNLTTENGGIAIVGGTPMLTRSPAETLALNFGDDNKVVFDLELIAPRARSRSLSAARSRLSAR